VDYTRQEGIVSQSKISSHSVSLIGCGALGSASAMALVKMGINDLTLYDEDGINEVNLPNQMYMEEHIGMFKVDALIEILQAFNKDIKPIGINQMYIGQPLREIVIVTTDSMASRQAIWKQFLAQKMPWALIEARMGAEEGQIYTIRKDNIGITYADGKFYEDRLYSDAEANQLPCTAKAIIYNVFMIASLVCRAYKAVVEGEKFPREIVFGMSQIHNYSFQIRD